ncbi:MAG TPA: hypothetical protein VK506_11830, partial [Conexibacter sp.]|nr:hypothetical protein [Conexibacter sp.]
LADGSDADSPVPFPIAGEEPESLDFSPDGTTMVYTAEDTGGTRRVFVAAGDGSGGHGLDLGETVPDAFDARLSADGTTITFSTSSDVPYGTEEGPLRDIYSTRLDGSHLQKLTDADGTYESATVSPDGETIYTSRREVILENFGFGIAVVLSAPQLWAMGVRGAGGHQMAGSEGVDPSVGRPRAQSASIIGWICGKLPGCKQLKEKWDELKQAERDWCEDHGKAVCARFALDAERAELYAEKLFTGPSTDSSMSNAFQHAYWTALMTRSAIINQVPQIGGEANLTSDIRAWGYQYSLAHETDPDTGEPLYKRSGEEGRKSRMDAHNNYVGYLLAYLYPERLHPETRNVIGLCTIVRNRVANRGTAITRREAELRSPSVAWDLPYWYVKKTRNRPKVTIGHLVNNSCR